MSRRLVLAAYWALVLTLAATALVLIAGLALEPKERR